MMKSALLWIGQDGKIIALLLEDLMITQAFLAIDSPIQPRASTKINTKSRVLHCLIGFRGLLLKYG